MNLTNGRRGFGGEMSYGMLLAAEDKNKKIVLLTVDKDIENGAEVL